MAQTFLLGVTNRNTGVRTKFSICRRHNHALGVTPGRYNGGGHKLPLRHTNVWKISRLHGAFSSFLFNK